MEDLLLKSLLGLPERIEKIERTLWEYRILLARVLRQTGLDDDGVHRAFADAEKCWQEFVEEYTRTKVEEWAKTPEGQEAKRNAEKAHRERAKELWREDCIEERQIIPDPTAED